MLRGIRAKLSGFRAGTRGVVLYLVAMLMVPFVVLIGVAVDMGQLLVMKNQLAAAVDAAALGAAGLPLDQAQTQAQAFVSANFSSQNPSATLTNFALTQVTLPDSRCPQANAAPGTPAVYVTDELTMNTAFLPVIGYNTLSATVSSCVTFANLEVVLVLDNTDSMSQTYGGTSGIDGVKQAATALVNTLLPAARQPVCKSRHRAVHHLCERPRSVYRCRLQ